MRGRSRRQRSLYAPLLGLVGLLIPLCPLSGAHSRPRQHWAMAEAEVFGRTSSPLLLLFYQSPVLSECQPGLLTAWSDGGNLPTRAGARCRNQRAADPRMLRMAELPSGTVTFLLTDIEGSTALWERDPEAMRVALARHDALMTAGIEAHSGVVVKSRGEGDSVFGVFARASDAVAAAIDLQRVLQAEAWPTEAPLRVRMALHTGEAELRAGDYYGVAVNRCARLRAAEHGGQILLSGATRDLLERELPAGVGLRDLGEHRLTALRRPERVFQVVIPGLPADFPPLRSLDTLTNNLPRQLTSFIGREAEIELARSRLLREDVHLLTLTGPGGTGKTRMALHLARLVADYFPDGVVFVALAPVQDPRLVASAIAQELGLQEAGNRPLQESLKDWLRDKRLLLVLDNFEHILAAAPLVADLLATCPRLKVLVTSRAVLHLTGEHQFSVPPLRLPDRAPLPPLERLSRYEAVHLFIDRAQSVKADFAVTSENAPAVAEICHRLDGLPLAIELAAAWIRLLSPQAMLARLERRLPLLTGGARDLPARQQTLRGAIAWSYDLLDEPEQRLFRRLAIFVGGCTLEAAEAVAGSPDSGELELGVLDGLGLLAEHSLLRQGAGPEGEP
ncbi:MAG TPA: AAA family ATPase, partial [Chloroflexota bacterium]|nr:AAA family ATPase [Chloroflexota bacterium]